MSYTSRDEFDLEKRVHFTNETPPYDMFDGLNSVLQTSYKNGKRRDPLWKWVLGYSKIAFDMPYAVPELNSSGSVGYYHDIDSGEVFYKMINGELADRYGPNAVASSTGNPKTPKQVHTILADGTESTETVDNDDVTYTQIEEYGVLLPEFDYLLHEVYRYLENLYPDHPDYIYLLTDNEFNDSINAAGALIDYKSDNAFYDKLASSLGLTSSTDDYGISDVDIEAAMIKIRNLRNESFRRKLYGSKLGYRMLASDIYQNATVFPVATYLPIKPITFEDALNEFGSNSPANNVSMLKEWNEKNGYEYNKSDYTKYIRKNNRVIDTYSKYYYKKFRLIDLDGSNSSYPAPKDDNKYIFGFSVPFNENSILEYPAGADSESILSNVSPSDFYENSDIIIDTSYVISKNSDISTKATKWLNGSLHIYTQDSKEVHSIETSIKNPVLYKTLYSYAPLTEVELTDTQAKVIRSSSKFTSDNYDIYHNNYPQVTIGTNFIQEFYLNVNSEGFTTSLMEPYVSKVQLITNPYVENTMFAIPSVTLGMYPTTVVGVRPSTSSDKFYMYDTPILWNYKPLTKGRYIAAEEHNPVNRKTQITSLVELTNFTKGKVVMTIDGTISSSESITLNTDDRYAFVVENEDGNLVVLEGKLSKDETYSGGRYYITKEELTIEAVPEQKSISLVKFLYDDYTSLVAERRTLMDTEYDSAGKVTFMGSIPLAVNNGYDLSLAEAYLSDDNATSAKASEDIKATGLNYSTFISYVSRVNEIDSLIASYKKNREYIYKDSTYQDKENNTVSYEETLIYPGCTVKQVLNLSVSNSANTDDGIAYDTYSAMGNGEISEINFGYFNFTNIYESSNLKISLPSGVTLDSNSIPVQSSTVLMDKIHIGEKVETRQKTDPETGEPLLENGEPVYEDVIVEEGYDFYYLKANTDYTDHQTYTQIIYKKAPDGTAIEDSETRYIYGTPTLSTVSTDLINYCANSYDGTSTNITCKPIERTDITIESVIDVSEEGLENVISFETDLAKELFKSLSVGDIVTGPSIDSDDENIFIISIGDNQVYLNKNLQQSGTFVLTYSVKMLAAKVDISDNLNLYKDKLYENGLYSVTNPFEHGLWPSADYPYVSRAILDSLPDVSFYKLNNYRMSGIKDAITIIMDSCYADVTKASNEYLVPSDIKFNNELFYELNLNKLLKYESTSGVTPILMGVDWLDYLENSLKKSSRATDNVNVGVNLMMETDTSGYYTLLSGQSYTDPGINLKFITMNIDGNSMWPETNIASDNWTIPVYAQIGTGGEGRRKWFTSPDDISYPSVYGVSTFDGIKNSADYDTDSDFYKNNGELRKASVWGNDPQFSGVYTSATDYNSVESPLFEVPLGEYDTVIKYLPNEKDSTNLLSVTQVSFYAQTFSNLLKYFTEDDDVLMINGKDITSSGFLTQLVGDEFYYAGTWIPTKSMDSDGYYQINYPANPEEKSYYVIDSDCTLTNIGKDMKNYDYSCTDILFYYKGNFELRSFQYMGGLGNGLDTVVGNEDSGTSISYVVPSTNLAPGISSVSYSTTDENNNVQITQKDVKFTLTERLLQYYLRITDYYNSTQIDNVINCLRLNSDDPTRSPSNLKTAIEAVKGDKTNYILDTYMPYYVYVGTRNNTDYTDGNDISEGDRVVLVQLGSGDDIIYLLFKVNLETVLGATLPVEQFASLGEAEMNIINGNNKTAASKGYDFGTTVDSFNSKFDLPRKYLTPGSLSFNFIVDPHFISQGYVYEDDNVTLNQVNSKLVSFCTTKGAIYYDSTNDAFYCYSNIYDEATKTFGSDVKKIAIKFNEQKFFKNVMNITGIYQIKNTLDEGETTPTKKAIFTGIDGVSFDISKLASNDRILKIETTELRSVYNRTLEPAFFSNYTDLDYTIRGITDNNELYLSFIQNNGSYIERMNFSTDISKFTPLNFTYDEDTGMYSSKPVSVSSIKYGTDYSKPELRDYKITSSLISNNVALDETVDTSVNRDFIYFKNNLIFKASVNATNPRVIVPSENSRALFAMALDKVSVGDTLVSGIALTDTGIDTLHTVSLYELKEDESKVLVDSSYSIAALKVANGRFICSNSSGKAYYNDNIDIDTITDSITVKAVQLVDSNKNNLSGVVGIDYDYDTNSWCIECQNGSTGTSTSETDSSLDSDLSSTVYSINTETGTASNMYTSAKNILLEYDDEKSVLGHSKGDIASDYLFDGNTYSHETGEAWYTKLDEKAVISGIGSELEESSKGVGKVSKCAFYKDFAMSSGVLTKNSALTTAATENDVINNYVFDVEDKINSPYITSTLRTNSSTASLPLSSALKSRTVHTTSPNGMYSAYIKGRDLFIKSPTALVELNENKAAYEYSGETSTASYWKSAKSPMISDNTLMVMRENTVTNSDNVYDLLMTAGARAVAFMTDEINLSNNVTKGVKYNGSSITKSNASVISDIKTLITTLVGATSTTVNKVKEYTCNNIMTLADFKTIKNITSSSFTKITNSHASTSGGTYNNITAKFDSANNKWVVRISGFHIISETITDENISVIGSDVVKFAEFGNDYYEDIEIEKTVQPDFNEAYAMYAYYLDYYVLGDAQDTSLVMSSNIRNAVFTNTNLYIIDNYNNLSNISISNLSKREDIENPKNWNTAIYPENFAYMYQDNNLAGTAYYKYDGAVISVPKDAPYFLRTIFNMTCSYINSEVIILGGYFPSKTTIESLYKSAMADSDGSVSLSDDEKDYLDALKKNGMENNYTCPAVIYSLNGGATFNSVSLPEMTENSSSNLRITSIKYIDGEYHFVAKKTNNSSSLSQFYYIEKDTEKNVFDFSQAYLTDMTDTEVSLGSASQLDVDDDISSDNVSATQILNTSTSANAEPVQSFHIYMTPNRNTFDISTRKGLTCDVTVTGKSGSSITVSKALISTADSQFDVLVSFNTREDIPNQATYIDTSNVNEYFTKFGSLKVAETSVVATSATANRMYSYREMLSEAEKSPDSDVYDMLGYPSISEDTDHKYYEYNTQTSSDGDTVYSPISLTNSSDSTIKLCDVTGSRLVLNDSATTRNLYTFYNRMDLPDSYFVDAYETIYDSISDADEDPTFRSNDDVFNDYFGKNPLIAEISFSKTLPYIKIDMDNSSLLTKLAANGYLFEESDAISFAEYLTVTTAEITTYGGAGITIEEDIAKVKYTDSSNQSKDKYILKDINGTNYWYDQEKGIFVLKSRRFLTAKALMPYAFSEGIKAYKNLKFTDVEDEAAAGIDTYITGVYLSNFGYGGGRNNQDLWSNTLPWLNDPSSFESSYLKNSRGDYVYLVDENGNRIKSNIGEVPATIGSTVSVSRSDITGSTKSIKLFDAHSSYTDTVCILDEVEPEIYTPLDSFSVNATGEGVEFLEENKGKDYGFNMTFFVIKNGRIITDKIDTFDFYYVAQRPTDTEESLSECYDFTIDKEKNLLVFDVSYAPGGDYSYIKALVVKFTYNGKEYSKRFTITGFTKNTPWVKVDRPILFRKTGDTYSYVPYDFTENKAPSNSSYITFTFNVSLDSTNKLYNQTDYSSESTAVYYTPTVNDGRTFSSSLNLSVNQFTSLSDISCVPLNITTDNNEEIYTSINIPVFDVGDLSVSYYNDISYNTDTEKYEQTLKIMGFFGDEKVDITYDSTFPDNICSVYYGSYKMGSFEVTDALKSSTPSNNIIYYLNPVEGNIIYYGKDTLKFNVLKVNDNGYDDTAYIRGIAGEVICHKPSYDSYYELLSKEGYVIGNDGTLFEYNGTTVSDIKGVDENSNSVEFSQPFGMTMLDDGEAHNVTLKILTQSTIPPEISTVNDPDSFVEIELGEIETFTPDRVWFNPSGFPTPPVEIGNYVFNSDNNSEYYDESYKNNNNSDIYRCNEEGYLVGYKLIRGTEAAEYSTSDVEGYEKNSSGTITAVAKEFVIDPATNTLDNAQIPRKPLYTSCQNWFKNEFYLKGSESNPYWQVISIKDKFNNNKKAWEQYAQVNEYVRSSQSMTLQEVDEDDKYISIQNAVRYDINDTSIDIIRNSDFVDVESGEIRFLLTKPAEQYQTNEQFVKYGITATNPFYSGELSNVWNNENVYLAGYISSSYTVNSTENLADPNDHDSEIKEVTELGLFNANHKLIAYATFPPIEYRTNSQHVSFTCYIKMGSLTDPASLTTTES